MTIVVDFVHVLEYLWRATWSFHDEGDHGAEAVLQLRALHSNGDFPDYWRYHLTQGTSPTSTSELRRQPIPTAV